MNQLTFLRICARIVEAWPESLVGSLPQPHLRPDCFAYLDEEFELDSDSMGKDERYQYKPEFFSRNWKDHDYDLAQLRKVHPGIFCWERTSVIDDRKETETLYLQFCIQDKYIRAYDHDSEDHEQRSKEEITQHLRDVRDTFIKHLVSMTYQSGVAGLANGWYPTGWLEAQGFPTNGGTKLAKFITVDTSGDTLTRNIGDGGVIETYFAIRLRTVYCASIAADGFNYASDLNLPVPTIDDLGTWIDIALTSYGEILTFIFTVLGDPLAQVTFYWEYKLQGSDTWLDLTNQTTNNVVAVQQLDPGDYFFRMRYLTTQDELWSDYSNVLAKTIS